MRGFLIIKTHRGSALILTLSFLALLWLLLIGFAGSALDTLRLSSHAAGSERALWAAESGLRLAVASLAKNPDYRPRANEVKMEHVAAAYNIEIFSEAKSPVKIPQGCLYVLSTGKDLGASTTRKSAAVVLMGTGASKSVLGFSVFADSLILNGGCAIDSFDSTQGSSKRGNLANVATNSSLAGAIRLLGGSHIMGSMQVGVGGVTGQAAPSRPTTNSSQVIWKDWSCYSSGEETAMTTPLDYPPVAAPSPGTTSVKVDWKGVDLAEGKYGDLSAGGGGEVRLKGGTYVFSSLVLSGGSKLVFNGSPDKPVVIYVTKSVDLSGGTLSNTTLQPKNLTFMLAKGVKAVMSGGAQAYAVVYGPEADFTLNGGTDLYGAVVGRSVELRSGASIHYDTDLIKNPPPVISPTEAGAGGATVISWQRS